MGIVWLMSDREYWLKRAKEQVPFDWKLQKRLEEWSTEQLKKRVLMIEQAFADAFEEDDEEDDDL
ncbi:hypothetical protein [Shouchella tritolerans]|uniref:hypothetical protein n=1 Tax=Shouchella tritolerans TaxID=2979466 RepID=UPI0021E80381|nr:hypothetical protein [Shouchella tritolerans]